MVQIILISGNWQFEGERWLFNPDSRGNREVVVDGATSFNRFVQSVYDEYGVCLRKEKIELTYMYPKKILATLPTATRPVILRTDEGLKAFLEQFKGKTCRLCVSVNEIASVRQKRRASVEFDSDIEKEADMVDEEDGGTEEDEGTDEDESIFDCCEDYDGASSGDEDYDLYGTLKREEESAGETTVYVNDVNEGASVKCTKIDFASLDVVVGQRFDSKDALVTRLQLLSVAENFDFNVDYSRPELVIVKCWIDGCTWRIRATTVGDSPNFYIKVYVKEHTCSVTERGTRSRQATKKLLGKLYYDSVGIIGPNVTPDDVSTALQKGYSIKVGYWKAYGALKHARSLATGTPESGYEQLPSYLYLIRKANPGTYTSLEVDGEERFKSLFIAFGACITGFQYMRKVLVVDGTYLKGKYKGTLLVAASQDGNFKIFPIAFAVVDTENDESWEWFFKQLSQVIPDDAGLSIISDRHRSIATAIGKVYPLASRGICTYHMYKNILMKFKGGDAFRLVKKAANA